MKISKIKIDQKNRIRETSGKDVTDLKESMKEFGLLHPITINDKNKLISGYRRLKAAKALGWKEIDVTVKTGLNEYQEYMLELEENLRRKNLSQYELAISAAKAKRLYEETYPETVQGANIVKGKEKYQTKESLVISRVPDSGKRDRAAPRFSKHMAKTAGVSETTVQTRAQLGKAILNGKFDKETVEAFKTAKKTQADMLKKDKERRKKERTTKKDKAKKLAKEAVVDEDKSVQEMLEEAIPKEVFEVLSKIWCQECDHAKYSTCPHCVERIIVCDKSKNVVVKKIDVEACDAFKGV